VIEHFMGQVVSLNVNPQGGVPKYPVNQIRIHPNGVEGDKQNDLKYHGGPTRAVCLFSFEKIEQLKLEGHPISVGTTGENITVKGIDWNILKIGMKIVVGDVVLKLTNTAPPCKTISKSFNDGKFSRILEKNYPGWSRWYASVVKGGIVNSNDFVSLE
jgi:MOSC domain-containing protein YiiM